MEYYNLPKTAELHTTEYELLHCKQFKKNLSGNQIETLLNYFLYKALCPFIQTLWFKNQLALGIDVAFRATKHRILNDDRLKLINHFFNAISVLNVNDIIKSLKESGTNREVLLDIIDLYLRKTQELLDLDVDFYRSINKKSYDTKVADRIATLVHELGDLPISFYIKTSKESRFWFNKYLDFRDLILSKYYRLAFKYAKMTKYAKPNVDEQCLFKSFVLAINTALNKYSSKSGALTSYIILWFKSTLTNPRFDYSMGRPFKLSNYAKNKMVQSGMSVNSISTEDEDFSIIESKMDPEFLDTKLLTIKTADVDLLNFLNSVQDNDLDLVKILLNIPKTNL